MSDSPKAPVTLLNSVSAANAKRLEAIHSRCLALGAAPKDLGLEAAAELTGFVYELIQMPINGASPAADTNKAPDHSLMVDIHRSTAKAIADVIHTCSRSDVGLEQLDQRTVPALLFAIEWHLEEADNLEEEERLWREATRSNAKGAAASH
jgi:hypothetical protein